MKSSVPQDWKRLPITEIAHFGSGDGISVAKLSRYSPTHRIPVFGGNGVAGYTNAATVQDPTVIIGRVGQKCGSVYTSQGPAWITDNALYAQGFRRPTDVHYLALALEAAQLNEVRNHNDLPLITQGILRDVEIPWPEAVTEQRAISAAITDVDDLINAIQRQVSKKQAVKQGIMQELLTGRTRLPGFNGEWTTRRIGDFAEVRAGGTPSTAVSRYWGGDVRWMSSGEIHAKRVSEAKGRITADGLRESAARLLPSGTVLMALAGQGKTRGTVAISLVALSTNQSIAGILPGSEHDPTFLYYNLDTRYEELRGESSGDGGRGGLNLTIIKNLNVFMPGREEQAAIATVLTDVDDEIDGLNRQLCKAREVKQGTIQELLTGRTRLPVGEGA